MPVKLCYMGNTFINSSDYQGRLKESTQCGAELIGDSSIAGDAEILSMVVDSLLEAGLKRFQISSPDELPDYDDLMNKIKLLHGDDGDNYLFKKDVYDETKDPEFLASQEGANDETAAASTEAEDIPSVDKEDVPDFLKGEKVDVIE